MAQLIVERSSIIAAILPAPDHDIPGALSTQHALMLMFCSYLQKVMYLIFVQVLRFESVSCSEYVLIF
jgi:hypothetical protein